MLSSVLTVQVNSYRRQLDMRVAGFDPPKPVKTFAQCGFDAELMAAIKKAGYERPTAIQAQALPAALSGRDVLVRSAGEGEGGGDGRGGGMIAVLSSGDLRVLVFQGRGVQTT